MAIQSVQSWGLALMREFIKGGSVAAHASLAAMFVMPDQININHPWTVAQLAGSAFLIKGLLGAFDYLSKDPVPLDEEESK